MPRRRNKKVCIVVGVVEVSHQVKGENLKGCLAIWLKLLMIQLSENSIERRKGCSWNPNGINIDLKNKGDRKLRE